MQYVIAIIDVLLIVLIVLSKVQDISHYVNLNKVYENISILTKTGRALHHHGAASYLGKYCI